MITDHDATLVLLRHLHFNIAQSAQSGRDYLDYWRYDDKGERTILRLSLVHDGWTLFHKDGSFTTGSTYDQLATRLLMVQ